MKRAKPLSRFIFLSACLLAFQFPMQAQTLKEFFNDSNVPLFYLGIDFTRARLIDDATANEQDIVARQYTGINELVITEAKKFDVKGAFHRNNVDHDLGYVNKRNESANAAAIKSTSSGDFHRLKEDSIAALVRGYDFGGKKGIGLLIVMEAMSKSEKAAAAWVTLIDMGSKKVLLTERIESKSSMSFGFRNYWATTVKNLLETIEKKKYNEWKAKYGA
ncbi:MAG TPA: hypothetical protein VK543_04485 [Puia sp.]|nr:hypothetical protein [Puia sp.]